MKTIQSLTLILLMANASSAFAQSPADTSNTNVRESANTAFASPGRYAFDASVNTAWQIATGERTGWVEQSWQAARRLSGARVNLSLPEGVSLTLSTLRADHWTPIPSSTIHGPIDRTVTLVFPGELPPATRVLATVSGNASAEARVWDIEWISKADPKPYTKILPHSYTFNQTPSINLNPPRLWDGIVQAVWFEPLWFIPHEVLQTDAANRPDSIFGPLGYPSQNGEIVWTLEGTYEISTLKAYFLQDWRSLRFEFWNGTSWTNAQTLRSSSTAGWKRIDLANAVSTDKIRITFPDGWDRARFIGELEVWGSGFADTAARSLLAYAPTADGKTIVPWATSEARNTVLEVTTSGVTSQALTGDWNGKSFSVSPSTWTANETIYRLPVSEKTFLSDTQVLTINSSTVTSVVVKTANDTGKIDLGWPYNDGFFETTSPSPSEPVPAIENKTWTFPVVYQLDRLRVWSKASTAFVFKTALGNTWTNVPWTSLGDGWWEADLAGIKADKLSVNAASPVTLDEIQLFGSPLADTRSPLEIWWPKEATPVTSDDDSNSMIGWMGDPSVRPVLNGYHPRQADRIFWMPLNRMGGASGEEVDWPLVTNWGSFVSNANYHLRWTGKNPPAKFDQNEDFLETAATSFTVSGTLKNSASRVFVGANEVQVTGKSFMTDVPLNLGFQKIRVEVWNKTKTKLQALFSKPIFVSPSPPLIQFDLPAGDLSTSASSLLVTGRLGGSAGLALTANAENVPVVEGSFSQVFPLSEGTQVLTFVCTDRLGRTTTKTLTIVRDTTPPTISIQSPGNGAFVGVSNVTLSVRSNVDSELWWQFDDGEWEAGTSNPYHRSQFLPDGTYTKSVRAQDRNGNLSNTASVTFTVDTTAPQPISLSTNVDGWTNVSSPTLYFSSADATSGIDYYSLSIDSATPVQVTSPYTLPTLTDGEHIVVVTVFDKSGLSTSATHTFFIDTNAPRQPQNVKAFPGVDDVELSWEKGDGKNDVDLSPISYSIERIPAWENGIRSIGRLQTYRDSQLTAGEKYRYRIWAVDAAGNSGEPTDWIEASPGTQIVSVNPSGMTVAQFSRSTISIPHTALTDDITHVLISQATSEDPSPSSVNTSVSPVFHFRVQRTENGISVVDSHYRFKEPISVALSYDPESIPPSMTDVDVKPFYFDDLWGRWLPLSGAIVDSQTHTVYFSTDHFTDYNLQATKSIDLTPQQLRDVQYSPFKTKTTHDPVTISAKFGSVSTGFTEFVLPGKNDFDLVVKRQFDSNIAQYDSSGNQGDPWYLGPGWRLNFPSIRWNGTSFWITDQDGNVISIQQSQLVRSERTTPTFNSSDLKYRSQLTQVYENHENTDVTIQVVSDVVGERRQNSDLSYFYTWTNTIKSIRYFSKDGREIEFDENFLVKSIYDNTRKNAISFSFSDKKAQSITDSIGRVIQLSYRGQEISEIALSTESQSSTTTIRYTYDTFGRLVEATDIGGRVWSYAYETKSLQTLNSGAFTNTYDGSNLKEISNSSSQNVAALVKVSGPGIGITEIGYTVKNFQNYSSDSIYSNYVALSQKAYYDQLVGISKKVYLDSDRLLTTETYTYSFSSIDNRYANLHQISNYSSRTTIEDDRSTTINTFDPANNPRFFSFVRNVYGPSVSFEVEQTMGSSLTNEVVSLPSSVTSQSKSGTILMSQTNSWNKSKAKVLVSKTTKSNQNYQEIVATYDNWGNVTKKVTTSVIGDRSNTLLEEYSYYNVGSLDLSLGRTDLSLTDTVFLNHAKNRIASQRKADTSKRFGSSVTETVEEFKYNTYSSLGQILQASTLLDDNSNWGVSRFEYDPTTGQLTKTVSPRGQITLTSYDYTTSPSEYRVETTKKDVQLSSDSFGIDLVTRKGFDKRSGNLIWSQDARGFVTTTQYDLLGRVVKIVEPRDDEFVPANFPATALGDRSTNPITSISYDDVLLTSTVVNPLSLSTKYTFDSIGRVVRIEQTDSDQQSITTTMSYDRYHNITEVHGPVSSRETDVGRTLQSLTTFYSYDELDRVLTVKVPGNEQFKTTIYDDSRNLATTTDEVGTVTTQVLDWNEKTIRKGVYVSGELQESQTYYDASGRILSQVDANQNAVQHYYGSQGLEIKTLFPSRTVSNIPVVPEIRTSYNAEGNVVRTIQPLEDSKVRTTFNSVINGLGQILKSEIPVGSQTIVSLTSFDANGNKTSESSGYDHSAFISKSWEYDSHNRVARSIDENGYATKFSYDALGNKTLVVDPRNGIYPGKFQMKMEYDQFSRLVSAELPSYENEATATIKFKYDGKGNLVEKVDADGIVTQFSYTLRNQISDQTITDGISTFTTKHFYDASGREIRLVQPSLSSVLTEYDEAGRIVKQGSENSGWSRYRYDAVGNLLTFTDGNLNKTEYTYNTEGKITSTTDARGNTSYLSYDRWNQTIARSDNERNRRTYEYDPLGRIVKETTPTNSIVEYSYDAWNNVVQTTDARGNTFVRNYTPTHKLEREYVNGALSRSYTYDEAGDLKTSTDGQISTQYNTRSGTYLPDPYSLVRSKTESVAGELLTMKYSYDRRQRLVRVTNPDTTSIDYTYNALGQIEAIPGWISNPIQYDTSGRISSYRYANGVLTNFQYDSEDRLSNLNYSKDGNSIKSYRFTYDQVSNIISKTVDGNSANRYTYDKANQLIDSEEHGFFKIPFQQLNLAYGYQDRDYYGNQVMTFTVQPTDLVELDIAKRSVGVDLGSDYLVSVVELTPLSTTHRVRERDLSVYSSLTNSGEEERITDWTYRQKDDGSIVLHFSNPVHTRYLRVHTIWDDRDLANQTVDESTFKNKAEVLIRITAFSVEKNQHYNYDKNGNRNVHAVDGQPRFYEYYRNEFSGNLSWIKFDGHWNYTYDNAGNRTSKAKALLPDGSIDTAQEYWNYLWDPYNRLAEVQKNGTIIASYRYNSENLKVERTGNDGTTVYAYGRSGALTYQKNLSPDGLTRSYTYLDNTVIGWTDTQNTVTKQYFALTDQLGSVTQITDLQATVVWNSEYDPFGETTGDIGTYAFDGSFAGHQVDADTGLISMWNRWQDPNTGGFISEDPLQSGLNWYTYTSNNPLTFKDPTGLSEEPNSYGGTSSSDFYSYYGYYSSSYLDFSYFEPSSFSVSSSDFLTTSALRTATFPGFFPTVDTVNTGNSIGNWATGIFWSGISAPSSILNFSLEGTAGLTQIASLSYNFATQRNFDQDLTALCMSPLGAPAIPVASFFKLGTAANTVKVAKLAQIEKELSAAAKMTETLAKSEESTVGYINYIQSQKAIQESTKLAAGKEGSALLKPYGGPGGGHHVPAKSGFVGAAGYDINAALAIPNAELARLGVSHSSVTGAQMTGYLAFARTGQNLTWESMATIETNALVRGGMNPAMAQSTVNIAIQALKNSGVANPTRIPWGK